MPIVPHEVPVPNALAFGVAFHLLVANPDHVHAVPADVIDYLPALVPQIPYVVAAGARGALGRVTWKGRRIQ